MTVEISNPTKDWLLVIGDGLLRRQQRRLSIYLLLQDLTPQALSTALRL